MGKFPEFDVVCTSDVGTCVLRWRDEAKNHRYHIWINADGSLQRTIHRNLINDEGKSFHQSHRELSAAAARWIKLAFHFKQEIEAKDLIAKAIDAYKVEKAAPKPRRSAMKSDASVSRSSASMQDGRKSRRQKRPAPR